MGIKNSQLTSVPGNKFLPSVLGSLNLKLTSLGNTPIAAAPTVPNVVRIIAVGSTGVYNASASPATWELRGVSGASTAIWARTTNANQSDGIFRLIPVIQGDDAVSFEFVSGTAPDLNININWTDVPLLSTQGIVTATYNGTTPVKLVENNVPGTIVQSAGLYGVGGEAAIEPEYTAFNIDTIDHGFTTFISPDNGVTLHEHQRDSSPFRTARNATSDEFGVGLKNGESFWVAMTEGITTTAPFARLIFDRIPEL